MTIHLPNSIKLICFCQPGAVRQHVFEFLIFKEHLSSFILSVWHFWTAVAAQKRHIYRSLKPLSYSAGRESQAPAAALQLSQRFMCAKFVHLSRLARILTRCDLPLNRPEKQDPWLSLPRTFLSPVCISTNCSRVGFHLKKLHLQELYYFADSCTHLNHGALIAFYQLTISSRSNNMAATKLDSALLALSVLNWRLCRSILPTSLRFFVVISWIIMYWIS